MPCGGQGTVYSSLTPCLASLSSSALRDALYSFSDSPYDVARNGMPSMPNSGSSFSKLTSRISPACAWPPCTARLISGALNSDAFGCTWILSLPPVALSTSAANWLMFSVWKLFAG
jgi:hypothetical protein